MRFALLLGVAAMTLTVPAFAGEDGAGRVVDTYTLLKYPKTKTVPVAEEQFGVKVVDPYRWLEEDVRNSKQVADWVASQKAVSDGYLDTLPGKVPLATKMKALYNYERYSLPDKAGGHYFFTKNDGLQNQSVLYVRKGLKGKDRVLIDPNTWAKDGATALDAWVPSKNGKLLAYSVQDGGSDWRTIRVLDVATGKPIGDEIKWAKFTNIAWIGNEGFLYSRFVEPKEGEAFQQLNFNQTVYFHKIGTPQSEDQVVYATPDRKELGHSAEVTQDGRWVVITSAQGTDEKYEINLIEMPTVRKGKITPPKDWLKQGLIYGLEHDWQLVEGIGDTLYFVTNKDAPKLKVIRVDLTSRTQRAYKSACGGFSPEEEAIVNCVPRPAVFKDIIPERTETLARAQIVGDRLVLSYLKDAASMAMMTDLNGKPVQQISLNSIGTASGFSGKPGDPETFYSFSSFNQPGAIYRFDSRTGKSTPFALSKLSFKPQDIALSQVFYPSKDGTKIPMFIVHRKDLDLSKGAPTILYGYGGFNVSSLPGYSPTRMAWIQSGGVFALANIRGGGEYGKPWHDAGRLLNKQNVFDDFIAAGEYLIGKGITTKDKLAVEGRSNGGLLVGAVVNQRPDLFAAGHAAVGVMDMLRFDRFTAGRYWVDDYGYPNKEADFKNLLGYSPYHNIKSRVNYPAVIVSTADTDDRVVPGHSFKYISALQAADTGAKPKIIRIETRAGHGSGKPTDKLIEEYSEIYAFLAKWTGLELSAY
ncbi:MAG: prolyl oligopeptidase family serine peptidase [Sphingorhabdus sp.]